MDYLHLLHLSPDALQYIGNHMNKGIKLYGLAHVMKLQGLTCYQLANMMNKHEGYRTNLNQLRKLEKGCTRATLVNICKALKCEAIDLIEQPTLVKTVQQFNYLIAEYIRSVNAIKAQPIVSDSE